MVGVLCASLLLAGCTAASEIVDTATLGSPDEFQPRKISLDGAVRYSGMPRLDLPADFNRVSYERYAMWLDDDRTFSITTSEKGACAPVPVSIEVRSPDSIVVSLNRSDLTCSDSDLGSTATTEIDLPAESTERPIVISFRYLEPGEESSSATDTGILLEDRETLP